ncbi:aquaporin [Methanoculleus sp.]|jgi:glycerol uptake facilitator protein|uniref:aquaporin n=1 Tax=Methanoculleus sp. TaxID=90427 RepID=UPI001BD5C765
MPVSMGFAGIITTIGNLTGTSLNPARTFGPYLGDRLPGGQNLRAFFPIYIVGAMLAAFLHDYLADE